MSLILPLCKSLQIFKDNIEEIYFFFPYIVPNITFSFRFLKNMAWLQILAFCSISYKQMTIIFNQVPSDWQIKGVLSIPLCEGEEGKWIRKFKNGFHGGAENWIRSFGPKKDEETHSRYGRVGGGARMNYGHCINQVRNKYLLIRVWWHTGAIKCKLPEILISEYSVRT